LSLGRRWWLEAALRAERHFADWRYFDRVSGAAGALDDYLTTGVHSSLGLRF
jgi:hypothetical protein